MTLLEHAQRELDFIKCDEPEKTALLKAVEGFATGGWSGGSVGWGIETLTRLLQFKPLSELNSDPNAWIEVGPSVWQSVRRPTTFSRDGGRSWYDIDDPSLNNGDVWNRDDANWAAIELGSNVKVDDRVRVRENAFDDQRLATMHNGREAEVIGFDGGRLIVRYDDGHEFRFLPELLEVLKTD